MAKLSLRFKYKLPVKYDDLTIGQRREVREQYVKAQNYLCHHCGAPLERPPSSTVRKKKLKYGAFPPKFFDYPIHLHHSHKNGFTIGAVHAYCNAVLWQYYGE